MKGAPVVAGQPRWLIWIGAGEIDQYIDLELGDLARDIVVISVRRLVKMVESLHDPPPHRHLDRRVQGNRHYSGLYSARRNSCSWADLKSLEKVMLSESYAHHINFEQFGTLLTSGQRQRRFAERLARRYAAQPLHPSGVRHRVEGRRIRLGLNPAFEGGWLDRGEALAIAWQYDEAIACFEKAARLGSERREPRSSPGRGSRSSRSTGATWANRRTPRRYFVAPSASYPPWPSPVIEDRPRPSASMAPGIPSCPLQPASSQTIARITERLDLHLEPWHA
jgi:hypothetical protein